MKRVTQMGMILLLILGLVFSLAAGAQQEGAAIGEETQEPNLLRIRSVAWLTQKAFIDEAANKFMNEHPEIKVEFESFEGKDINKYIIQWSSGKSDMDLLVVENPEDTTAFMMKDMLYSFDELGLWDSFAKDKLVTSILDVGTIRGKVYYLPIMGEIYWINTNNKLLQDAGVADKDGNIPHPKTWDELLNMAAKATIANQAGMSIRLDTGSMENSFYSALKGLRGNFFEADGTTLVVDTPESREILQAWKKGVDNGWITTLTMTDRNAGRVAYKAGKLALLYDEAPKTVLQFIEEIYLTDLFQSKMLNTYGKMPSLKSAYSFATSPEWEQMLTATKHSVPAPQYRQHREFTNALADNIQAYLLGKQDLDSCLKAVKEKLDSIDKKIY
jgi:ABC-type glycerol-3-phosphate transport system substrate-binding protein